jgi:hypothetical protein
MTLRTIPPVGLAAMAVTLAVAVSAPVNAEPPAAPAPSAAGKDGKDAPKTPFNDNVKVTVTDTHYVIESDGIPNHPHGEFPNRDNPNRILKQQYKFKIPLKPQVAEKPTKLPMGPIGVAVNGIPFYNPYNREGHDAVEGAFAEVFDSCCGHPDPRGRYHYHKYPTCVKSPFKDEPGKHSPLIGFAFDGFALYGPNGEDGKPPADLDECNGHTDKERGYHYHVTAKFPYLLGAYKGVVERENFDHPRRRPGGPGGPGGPPRKDEPKDGPPRKDEPKDGPPRKDEPKDGPPRKDEPPANKKE